MVKLEVDGRAIEAPQGVTLLQACLDNDIYIPNLCFLADYQNPPASCRLCFVEIDGEEKPVTSCTVGVADGMVVRTDTSTVRRLQRAALRLLLSVHHIDCKHCPANKQCALQHMAKFLKVGLKPGPFEQILKETDIDREHPHLDYYPNRCVLCGKCIHVCHASRGYSSLTFAKRGFDTVISAYGQENDSTSPCDRCAACVEICPVGAIRLKSNDDPSDPLQKEV
ncbi:MAG: (2Fe-2S)-binding protein [Deltaproteobacteria bacterium]|nr:(2Fe-2S)-binding protein [Deltaproteobacteria bacterium]